MRGRMIGWTGGLMLTGALIANATVLAGNSSVMFTSYVPLQASPFFYLGLILFAVGALIGCFVFFGTLVIAKEERTDEGSIPLVTLQLYDHGEAIRRKGACCAGQDIHDARRVAAARSQ